MGLISSLVTSYANAKSQKNAANTALMWMMAATMQAEKARRDAVAAAIAAQQDANDQTIAAAEQANQKAEQAIRQANDSIQSAIDSGVSQANQIFQQAYGIIESHLNPYIESGRTAQERLTALTTGSPEQVDAIMKSDPGYQFRMQEGQQALERSAAARGGLTSGATGVALQKYGQDYASNEFQNAYARLMGLSQQGLGATNTLNAYQAQLAGTEAQGAEMSAQTRAQGAQNIGNYQANSAWNMANLKGNLAQKMASVKQGGAADIANQQISGYYTGAQAVGQNAWEKAAADVQMRNEGLKSWNNFVNNMMQGFSMGMGGMGGGKGINSDPNAGSSGSANTSGLQYNFGGGGSGGGSAFGNYNFGGVGGGM